MLETGALIDGKYRVLRVVGRGGMSVVYQAVNEKENKIWAIKEVRKENIRSSEGLRQNLSIETEYLKKLNHPNLPKIVEVIDTEEAVLIVMDYIEGNTLMKAIEETGAQDQDEAVGWALQLCDVLGYLHSRVPPIIYRDLKPSNVMLKPDGTIMLIDFGTAREFNSANSEDSAWFGTQGYAAPEQYGGHGQTDARTDIYCLGATMYHLVTGHNPSTPPYEMYPIRQWNPMLSSGLEEIIIKCTQRNPNDRYQSCAELLYALDHYQDLDIENKKVQRFKWKTFIASAVITLVMLIGMVGFRVAESSATSQTYDGYLSSAEDMVTAQTVNGAAGNGDGTEVFKEAIDQYKLAIVTNPGESRAYIDLLNKVYLADNVFSSKEYAQMNDLMKGITDGAKYIKTGDALLSADPDAYASVTSEIGDDLLFCYENDNGIATSLNWYERAEPNCSDTEKKELINEYIVIAKAYLDGGQIDDKGRPTSDPAEVFEALRNISNPEVVKPTDNLKVSLKCYKFISGFLMNKNDFFSLGINEAQYDSLLDQLSGNLDLIAVSDTFKNNPSLNVLMHDAESNIETARQNGLSAKKTTAGTVGQ